MMEQVKDAPPGRRGQARRNGERILEAAPEVFLNHPKTPVGAVAGHAGVGVSALYRRYLSKEDLLRRSSTAWPLTGRMSWTEREADRL
jgi:AcrR family transcriptional regulator